MDRECFLTSKNRVNSSCNTHHLNFKQFDRFLTMPDPKELTRLHENLNFHYPKSYLNAWAAGVRPDWATFLFKVFKVNSKIRNSVTMTAVIYLKEDVPALLDAENLIVMDLGCGPSICNIISASLCSHHIYMAELLEGNRKEIIKFLCNDTDAWNWAPYFEFQVQLLSAVHLVFGTLLF